MVRLNYVEFYITNVCNLSCKGCNRFNDTKFSGFQKWDDYKDVYSEWSKHIEFNLFALMGGEPLLNSTFYDWLEGLTNLWPTSYVKIATNGFRLPFHKKLYSHLRNNKKILLSISVHNKEHKPKINQYINDFLEGDFTYEFDNTPYRQKLYITDANKVRIEVLYNWWFHQGAIIRDKGIETLHNSDPEKAHSICHSRECHHFDKGLLYKCGPSALFKEYDNQYPLELSAEDRKLMNSVEYLSVVDDNITKKSFIDNIKNPIPQCKFCPEQYCGEQIFSQEKKDLKIQ